MGATVVWGHDLDVSVLFKPVAVLGLNPRVREANMAVVTARQAVILSPPCDLLGCPVGPAGAVGAPAIPLVEELLVFALELVVEDDPANASTLIANLRLGIATRTIDLDVVGQLARLPEARVEGLRPIAGVLPPVRFEQVKPTVGGNHDILVTSLHRDALQEAGRFQVFKTLLGRPLPVFVAEQLLEVAGLDDAEGRHSCERLALAAVQLVGALSLAHDLALGPARQVHVAREYNNLVLPSADTFTTTV